MIYVIEKIRPHGAIYRPLPALHYTDWSTQSQRGRLTFHGLGTYSNQRAKGSWLVTWCEVISLHRNQLPKGLNVEPKALPNVSASVDNKKCQGGRSCDDLAVFTSWMPGSDEEQNRNSDSHQPLSHSLTPCPTCGNYRPNFSLLSF